MSLNETVQQKLADWRPPEGRQTLLVPDEGSGWVIRITADRHDDLGSAVWELDLLRVAPAADATKTLSSWAAQIAGRVTGLLEPLRVIEIDVQRNQALLRSAQPSRRRDDLYYYEILLDGTVRASARRYRARDLHGHREQVAFTLTYETLSNFAADLAAG